MTATSTCKRPRFDIGEAKERLKYAIEMAFSESSPPVTPEAPVKRIEIPLTPVALLPILRARHGAQRTYWSSRGGSLECIGLGSAETLTATNREEAGAVFARMRRIVHGGAARVRYYGGMRFDPAQPPAPHWRSFALARFVLPRFEVIRENNNYVLACNIVWRDAMSPTLVLPAMLMELAALRLEPEANDAETPSITGRRDQPDETQWTAMLGDALERLDEGTLQKVVLARESQYAFDAAPDAPSLLERLIGLTQDSYHFCFETQDGATFVGASPERLYRRKGRRLLSEAVAGTRPRGRNHAEESEYTRALLESSKERHEHALVMQALREAFEQLCSDVQPGDAVSVLKLHCCQHLYWPIEGTLKTPSGEAHILRQLHPTPAVGGAPTPEAIRAISELEPFDRGWYAGPVGWIGAEGAEFAVAIRSGLINHDTLHLYSGAGIVPASTPAEEWAEIENKMGTFIHCIGGADD